MQIKVFTSASVLHERLPAGNISSAVTVEGHQSAALTHEAGNIADQQDSY